MKTFCLTFAITTLCLSEISFAALSHTCRRFQQENNGQSCFMQYDGETRGWCELCREGKSCFMSMPRNDRPFCEAYHENKSCFMSFQGEDRGWCEVLKEGQSCSISLSGQARRDCERGIIPYAHDFWLN